MANYYTDNDDLRFYFERGIDWKPLVELGDLDSVEDAKDLYRDIASLVGEFAAEEIAPHSAQIDREGVRLENGEVVEPKAVRDIFAKIRGLDLHGMCLPRELGGMNCPMLLYFINTELLGRADISVMAHHGFHGGMACAMLIFSVLEGTTFADDDGVITSTRFEREIRDIVAGNAWGCMDITEPDAGSDMAALRTVGDKAEDGSWTVTGQKIFLTSGHGKYHFVIARTEDCQGLEALSMFLVQTYEDLPDGGKKRLASLDRVEEKLGHHGSVTAAVTFDKAPAQLIGRRGEGFRHMLTLMNNARLGVGFETLGLCEAAYRLARDYAAQRPSMGKTIDRHEMIADYLDEMRTDIQVLRALCMHGALHEEIAQKKKLGLALSPPADNIAAERIERESKKHKAIARRVTPLIKYFGAEKAVEMARRCVQIHGGNGYMKEYGAEKLLRDAIVMPIYEGTSQIQALMAMKDVLGGVLENPQAFVKRLAQTRWRALSARDSLERRVARIQVLSSSAQQHLITRTVTDKFKSLQGQPLATWPGALRENWNPKRDFAYAMLHAERLIRLLIDEAAAEILLEQAKRHPERRELLERFLSRAEPRCRFLHDEITTTGDRLIASLEGDRVAV